MRALKDRDGTDDEEEQGTETRRLVPQNKIRIIPVSYTHLDVYKRQAEGYL